MIAPTLSSARATAIRVGIAGQETMSSSAPFCTTSHESSTPTRMSGATRRSVTASIRSSRMELLLLDRPGWPGHERLEHRLGADGDEDERPRVPPGEPHPVMDDAQEPGPQQNQHDPFGRVALGVRRHDLAQPDGDHQQRPPQTERPDLDDAQVVEHQHDSGGDHEQADRDLATSVTPTVFLHRLSPFPGPALLPATHGNLRTVSGPGAGFPANGGAAPVNGGRGDAGGDHSVQPSGEHPPGARYFAASTRAK